MLKYVALFACVFISLVAHAEVVSVDVTSRQPWVGGQKFGQIGAYEVLRGTVHYAIDPRSVSARDIADIRYAPRNASGLVEYSGPFVIIRPVDAARGNHATLLEAANRGRTEMDGVFFETEDGLDLMSPDKVEKLTDPTFFKLGYSLAWVGWQARLGSDEFGLRVPVAPVHSSARATFAAEDMTTDHKAFDLPGNGFYCAHDAQQPKAVLRSHVRFDDPGIVVPRGAWRFAAASADKNVDARCAIVLNKPAAADAYFSLVYEGENAAVMGLGEAAFRDFAAHLKFRNVPSAINSRPGDAAAIFAFGYSQGGRFLRDFLYRDFNTGPGKRRVFDGMLVTTAGAGRGSFNHRYALPGEAGSSVMSNLRAVDLYPFADMPTPDIDGKGHAGLLDRARHDNTVPKIMYIISSSEYWARNASLLQTTTDGKRPVALGVDSRLYYFAGVPHALKFPGQFTKAGKEAAYPYNANVDLADGMNAQLENLRAWAVENIAPPPTIAPVPGATLVAATEIKFPAIPGIRVPTGPPPLWQLDLGDAYASQGIINEPVRVGRKYPLLVPKVDSDGNELGGWRGAMSSVPLGTFTAWDWKSPEFARFGFISGLNGAFIPFARTRAERLAANDPRLSIEERYHDRDGFMKAAAVSIDDAIAKRFLLSIQREDILAKMGKNWDDTMKFDWYLGKRVAVVK
ncbi:alpha/beta hydrolase domain-containing protein [Rhodanobacter sp. L36]|uniref:alpha/beta hydrolase domain-containing protein n=1 Tax=Rhodanobacter sp. L36 TaxID=1747221 RepID=UPI00131CAB8C|nr:alpha/beta hydrolase domain-containing protein [Rhodanobacter sp. L36]